MHESVTIGSTEDPVKEQNQSLGISVHHIVDEHDEPKRFHHLPYLDGLRGLGMIMMMQFHSQGTISRFCSAQGGWWGIEIFFVLSGFLITSILLDEQKRTHTINLRNFYARRVIRLLPALTAYLLLILTVNPFASANPITAVGIALFYLSDFDIALRLGHVAGSGLDITWSLSIEEKYYAVWPLCTKYLRRLVPMVSLLTIILCVLWRGFLLCHGAPWVRMFALDTHVDGIMIGSLTAALVCMNGPRQMLSKVLGNGPASLALFATMMFSMRVLGHPELLNEQWQKIAFFCVLTPIIYLVIALLIVSLYFVQDSLVKRLLSHRGLTWIGELSYSLYLWHTFAFLVIAKRITGHCAEIAGWLLAFLFAFISYYVIEQPFSHLRKRFRT